MNCDTLDERRALLQSLGGLPETTVHNTEWLYMLEEDTRQSLAIEGYFASEEELEAVLSGQKSSAEITNYFRAAQTLYDQALQYYRDSAFSLTVSGFSPPHATPLYRQWSGVCWLAPDVLPFAVVLPIE